MPSGDLFLSRLPANARERFYARGMRLEIAEGSYLLRRGEPGGDVFVVTEGALEVVDNRYRPEVVLDTVGAGDIVGDMAFLDQGPRSADVRAIAPTACLKFVRNELLQVFAEDAEIAAEFYRSLCERMSDRHRELATAAVVGGIGRRRTLATALVPWVSQQSAEIAMRARSSFTQAQTQLRRDAEDGLGAATVSRAVRDLVEESSAYVSRFADPDQAAEAGRWIADELYAWLARASLGRRALGRAEGSAGLAQVRAAMLAPEPSGDDSFGVELERALFDLPTVKNVKDVRAATLSMAARALAGRAKPRVALLSPNPGTWLDAWTGPDLECVALGGGDPSRDARGRGTLLRLEADLLRLASGKSRVSLPPFDLVVVDGLLEHLSERWATLTLAFCGSLLHPDGSLVVAALPPTTDEPFFRAVLDMPQIRRSSDDLQLVLRHAGSASERVEAGVPAAVARPGATP
jgi:CRP/FNR family transcriptional regulator, cyclic AMP receptor protein